MEVRGEVTLTVINKNVTKKIRLAKEFLQFASEEKALLEEKYIPSVIECSFSIDRVVYCS
jgi:glycyl-tRNA synthetase (class II)